MSQVFETLQDRYRDLVARSFEGPPDETFLESLTSFLQDARHAGAVIADPEERSLLRSYIRFLATLLRRAGREVPDVGLQPLDQGRWPTRPPAARMPPSVPGWVWGLAGAAALVVLAGLVAVAMLSANVASLLTPSPTPALPTSLPPPTATPPPTPTATASPTATPEPIPPTLSDLTVALGMADPSDPLLPAEVFDWNTKTVYAAFDYTGMFEGLEWSAVWTRNGQEVAREEQRWDADQYGERGTRWVVYFNPEGTVLRGGDYTITLYIEEEQQAQASFRILYYVPATP